MGLRHADPATAETYFQRGQELANERETRLAELEKQKANDPALQANLACFAEQHAATRAEHERAERERLATERAAEAQAAETKIRAELARIGAPEADMDRLTAEALDRWRVERAAAAATAPSPEEQERQEIADYLARRAATRSAIDYAE